MADFDDNGQDKTEDPTPERRDEFRDRGQIAVSREISNVMVLGLGIVFLSLALPGMIYSMTAMLGEFFLRIRDYRVSQASLPSLCVEIWWYFVKLAFPMFILTAAVSTLTTFLQTRLNWSWQRLTPDFSRLNVFKGLKNMMSAQVILNLGKGMGKMCAVGIVSYAILFSEKKVVPGLMYFPMMGVWGYWGHIIERLCYTVSALLLLIGAGDYLFNFLELEKKLKMTKQEVKEDMKKHEVDPHIKGRLRKMQRDILFNKTIKETKTATVVITNPTHFAVALKYTLGMRAPIVVAKGQDEVALAMRSVAKESKVPIIENKPLARLLFKVAVVGQEIPESVYRAVSEIIRYVFKIKGIALTRKKPKGAK